MSGHLPMQEFPRNARAALGDRALRGALRQATDLFGERRKRVLATVPEWQELRERARAIKAHTLAHLDRHLAAFADRAAQAGAQVHWAPDAEAAHAIIAGIARGLGARRIVKSKSMTSEEIGLNDALERAGLSVVETDLGEWIIQLAREVPSHIIVPAIHKDRAQIGALLAEKLAMARSDDPETLTRAARDALRAEFARADLGISGVNFAVAETGSILILENEGNARLTTTLPRAHVALMGIEKVIPRWSDLEVFLKLLPRAGTGQELTSYQSILTGPERGAGALGPRELHIVILDNGRSRMLGHPTTRQALACIRCGACLNVCPVYQQVGGHAYGSVYPGPIGAVITPQLQDPVRARHLPFASSLCGACRDACPVKIDIPQLLLFLRGRLAGDAGGRLERLALRLWAWMVAGPHRYAAGAWIARTFGALARVLPPLRAWRRERELPPFAKRPFRALWKDGELR
jgi:L-lactate dehydrogenase complex protein LldF